MWSASVLFLLYLLHIVLMKYSNKYEVALKKGLANFMQLRELRAIGGPKQEMWRYH